MGRNTFAELAGKYFRYLTDDYGFSVVQESYYPQAFGDSLVQFQSSTTVVLVTRDKGQVSIDIGPSSEPRIAWHTLSNVIEFLAPGMAESIFTFPDYPGEPEKSMKVQLTRLAPILRQYGEPMLRGDFSKWDELERFILKGAQDNYKAMTGRELPETALDAYLKSKGKSTSDEGSS